MGGWLRPHQVEDIENEKRVIQNTLEHNRVEDRGNLHAHLRRIDKELSEKAPPDLTPQERDEKVKECREIEGRLRPLMPSDEEMRRNPPGVVGRHKKFEKAAKSRAFFSEGDLARWKDNQLALNKGDDDPDVANFERLRPLHNSGSMLGAQITGKSFFGTNPSPQYEEGWERTFGDAAEVAEDEEIQAPAVKRTRKKATRKKAKTEKKPAVVEVLACGRKMAKAGRHFHIKTCRTCQEAGQE